MSLILATIVSLLVGSSAGVVTAVWSPNTDGVTTGYRVSYGTASDQKTTIVDVGSETTLVVKNLTPGRRYYFEVVAYAGDGKVSKPSNEASAVAPGDPCASPFGAKSISIVVTGKLNTTGNKKAGSRAHIDYQAFSPNSRITYLAIQANGIDIPDSVASATGPTDRLNSPGALWFTMPPGPATFNFSVYARNEDQCDRQQATGFSATY